MRLLSVAISISVLLAGCSLFVPRDMQSVGSTEATPEFSTEQDDSSTTQIATPLFGIVADGNGDLSAYTHEGVLVWRKHTPNGRRVSISAGHDGTIIVGEGLVMDQFGRIVAFSRSQGGQGVRVAGVDTGISNSWSQPIELTSDSDELSISVTGPTMDDAGNGWAMISVNDGTTMEISITHAPAGTNNWLPPTTLLVAVGLGGAGVPMIHPDGSIVTVFRRIAPGDSPYSLEMLSYDPMTGSTTHETAYSSAEFFQDVESAIDPSGNIIAVMQNLTGSRFSLIGMLHDGEMWHGPIGIRTLGESSAPNLIYNSDRSGIYLVHTGYGNREYGVFSHRYVGGTDFFDRWKRVPGSRFLQFYVFIYPPPGVVDSEREATVFYESKPFQNGQYRVNANRTDHGTWLLPVTLARADKTFDITSGREHADVASNGDILFLHETSEWTGTVLAKYIRGHHYDADTGVWSDRDLPFEWIDTAFGGVRVQYRDSTSAIAVFNGPQPMPSGKLQLTSVVYENGWTDVQADIPGDYYAYIREFRMASPLDSRDVRLIFNATPDGWPSESYYGTLLQSEPGQ